jgi:glycerophosphoryl diester phosphodiesterase
MPVRRALAFGAEVLVPHWAIASKRLIRSAHRKGLKVIPWTVNYPLHMKRKILDGVDGIITNYPSRLTEVLHRIEQTQSKMIASNE